MSAHALEIKEEIRYYLSAGLSPHLADCVDMIPQANAVALYELISDMQYARKWKSDIANKVTEDAAVILEGFPEKIVHSKDYLTPFQP